MQAETALDVLAHALRSDREPLDEAGHAHEHVVEQRRRIGQHDPLGRAVADVAFVPQRLVFERGLGGLRRSRARPAIRSDRIGLRLCGIADEPFWPERNGSWTSPISVCWRFRISVAKRSSEPPSTAIAPAAACRSRWTIWVLTGSAWSPSAARTSASRSGARWLYVPTGPRSCRWPHRRSRWPAAARSARTRG